MRTSTPGAARRLSRSALYAALRQQPLKDQPRAVPDPTPAITAP
jgi:hypothetical protein